MFNINTNCIGKLANRVRLNTALDLLIYKGTLYRLCLLLQLVDDLLAVVHAICGVFRLAKGTAFSKDLERVTVRIITEQFSNFSTHLTRTLFVCLIDMRIGVFLGWSRVSTSIYSDLFRICPFYAAVERRFRDSALRTVARILQG